MTDPAPRSTPAPPPPPGAPTTRVTLVALAVAGVIALLSLLIPTGGGSSAAVADAGGTAPATSAPSEPCSGITGSLRPQGTLPEPGAMPAGSAMERIAQRGRLIAGVDQGKYLAGYRDPATGLLDGSDIDLVRSIAQAILGDPEAVQFVVLDISDRAAAVEDGRVDVVVNTFTITCARQRQIDFSTPYMAATQRLLVPAGSGVTGIGDLAGQPVCTTAGAVAADVLAEQPGAIEVVTSPFIQDCMLELQAGRVAAVSIDDVILAGLAAQDPQTDIVGEPLDSGALFGVGISYDNPDLVRFVNGVLEQARTDGTLAASFQSRYAGALDAVPAVPPATYRD